MISLLKEIETVSRARRLDAEDLIGGIKNTSY